MPREIDPQLEPDQMAVLSAATCELLKTLHRYVEPERRALLARRQAIQTELDNGHQSERHPTRCLAS